MYVAFGSCTSNEVGKEFDNDSGDEARCSLSIEERVFFSVPGESLSLTRRVGRPEFIDVLADLSSVLPASIVSGVKLQHASMASSSFADECLVSWMVLDVHVPEKSSMTSSESVSGALSGIPVFEVISQSEVMFRSELIPSDSLSLCRSSL